MIRSMYLWVAVATWQASHAVIDANMPNEATVVDETVTQYYRLG